MFDETFCVFKFYLCVQLSFFGKIFPGFQNIFLDQWSCGPIQGWIQHDLVGGGGVLCQLWCRVVSVMCAARPSTCFTTAKSCFDCCI